MDQPKVHWDVPKDHSKFFYKVAFNADLDRQSYILLDVLYEDCHYQQVERIPIVHGLIESTGEQVFVNAPSISDILGDKLIAYAPDTGSQPLVPGRRDRGLDAFQVRKCDGSDSGARAGGEGEELITQSMIVIKHKQTIPI